MAKILLCGIPGVGKTDLVRNTIEQMDELLEKKVGAISLGDLVGEEAGRLWNTLPERRPFISFSHQEVLRSYAVAEASNKLKSSDSEHSIIDTPLTMYLAGSMPNIIFSQADIARLHEACGGLNYLVTLIDDVEVISKKLAGTPYPKDTEKLLDWVAYEADSARAVAPSGVKTLVMPRPHSEQSLAKLLYDPSAPLGYFAFPIRSLKPKEKESPEEIESKREAKARIDKFREKFQEYAVLFVPMIIPDSRENSVAEIRATEHRDLNQFIKNSHFTLAFFPDEEHGSTGILDELKHTKSTGGYTILIHPKKSKSSAFGIEPDIHCCNGEEFFEKVHESKHSKYDGKPEAYLRRFLMEGQDLPRYALLQKPVVAIDFVNEDGEHLLIKQPEGKPLAGKWTLVAGKKEAKETDLEACSREALQ